MPKYEIKKLKTFKAHEGMQGFSCTLIINGKAAADIFNDCSGGEFEFSWLDFENGRKQETELIEYCKTLPKYKNEDYPELPELDISRDMFIENLVNEQLMGKEDARRAKQFLEKLNVKLPTDKKGVWSVWKLPPTPENKAKILAKHPKAIFLDEHTKDWRKIVG